MRLYFITIIFLISSCRQENSDWIDRTKHEGLYDMGYSESFEIYSTNENPLDIENTINNLEQAKEYFDKIFDENLTFAVLFVDNENWNKYAFSPPPGMPQAYYEGNIVLGLGKSVMATRAEQGLKQSPNSKLAILKQHFGEELNLDLFYRDALSLHELGHLYQFFKTGKSTQRRWLNEIFGNLCQVAASKNLKNQDVFNQMDSYQLFLIDSNRWGDLNFKTLDQFEQNYFEVMKQGQNYGWYQTQFYLIAKNLYFKYGDVFLVQYRDFLVNTSPEKIGDLDDEELRKTMISTFGIEAAGVFKWKYDN